MDSSIISVLEILSGNKKFTTLGFSDGYGFDEQNALEYFYQLLENATGSTPIFSGIIILEKNSAQTIIIDGLQRLLTVSLLLCALCENYKNTTEKNEEARKKIFDMFLTDDAETKIVIPPKDQEIYRKIVLGQKLTKNEKQNNLFAAYNTFFNEIKKQDISGTELFKNVSKIQFLVVQLESSEVSPRDLYQALNNKKDKSQVNLISDFVFKRGGVSGVFWQKTLQEFAEANAEDVFEYFLRDFLIIQNEGKKPNKNALYNKFKSYFGKMSRYQKTAQIVENICNYAKYYLKIINADFEDIEIKGQIELLNSNRGYDAYPYLMEVLDDFESGHLNTPVFLEILRMINTFVINRRDNPNSGENVDFSSLSQELNKKLVMKDYEANVVEEEVLAENMSTINEMNNLATFEV